MQDKAELHSKFSSQYLAELEALRAQQTRLGTQSGNGDSSQEGKAVIAPPIFLLCQRDSQAFCMVCGA